jgi:hypothetical protein
LKTKAFFTVNSNNHLFQNNRESFQDAARRWGADYIEITECIFRPPYAPPFIKLKAFDLCQADRIFCIDADCIIRGDTPSPFETFSDKNFVAVINKQPHLGIYVKLGGDIEKEEFRKIYNAGYPAINFNYDLFINSGMWCGDRQLHARILARALEIGLKMNGPQWWDQSPLNYALAEGLCSVQLADLTWNFCFPNTLGDDWLNMKKYVYHFAGMPSRYEDMPGVNWRV